MQKSLILVILLFSLAIESFAYVIKVYDQNGDKIGTYRRIGNKQEFYDNNNQKADLTESELNDIYDGIGDNNVNGNIMHFHHHMKKHSKSTSEQSNKTINTYEDTRFPTFQNEKQNNRNNLFIDTRFPEFHKF